MILRKLKELDDLKDLQENVRSENVYQEVGEAIWCICHWSIFRGKQESSAIVGGGELGFHIMGQWLVAERVIRLERNVAV